MKIDDMYHIVKKNIDILSGNIRKVADKIAIIRNVEVIADVDVADLYGVKTKEEILAVRNNPN